MTGHAIEARVNAEDAAASSRPPARSLLASLPATACASTPRSRPARVVGTDYDSMIAKVIAHGPDRATALARLDRALARHRDPRPGRPTSASCARCSRATTCARGRWTPA